MVAAKVALTVLPFAVLIWVGVTYERDIQYYVHHHSPPPLGYGRCLGLPCFSRDGMGVEQRYVAPARAVERGCREAIGASGVAADVAPDLGEFDLRSSTLSGISV
jgi:hypothetical protein